jgi:hypothetical protein
MIFSGRSVGKRLALTCLLMTISVSALVAQTPQAPPPSAYAPAKDLQQQVDFFMGRIDATLSDPAQYGEMQQDQVDKDANTLAVLALVLAMHDQQSPLKIAAPGLLSSAQALADSATDYAKAKAALADMKQALSAKTPSAPLQWQPVGDIRQLMLQVPVITNNLKLGVTSRRFERNTDQNAGFAATIAAIAQTTMLDTSYCADESDAEKWAAISAALRDTAAEVNRAVRGADQASATAALDRMNESCDQCHHQFRD